MAKSRKLVRSPGLSYLPLLTLGQHAATGLSDAARTGGLPLRPLIGMSADLVRSEYVLRLDGIAFLFVIARSLAGPSDATMPAEIAKEIPELWTSARQLMVVRSRAADILEDVLSVTVRGGALSSAHWRRMTECYRESGLIDVAPPGPVTPGMLENALACPIPGVREVGLFLLPHVQT